MVLLFFPIFLSIKRYLLPTELVRFSKSLVEQLTVKVTTLDPYKSHFLWQLVNSLLQRLFVHMQEADLFKSLILSSILLSSLYHFSPMFPFYTPLKTSENLRPTQLSRSFKYFEKSNFVNVDESLYI